MTSVKQTGSDALAGITRFIFRIGIGTAFVAFLAYGLHFTVGLPLPLANDSATWGEFGDYIGGILNPIVALCALLFVSVSLAYQRDALQAARAALELQRKELGETRAEMNAQTEHFEAQNETLSRQAAEQTFFQMLKTIRNMVDNLSVGPGTTGSNAMHHWAISLRNAKPGVLTSATINAIEAGEVFEQWYSTCHQLLAPYFQLVTRTLELVHRVDRPDKVIYAEVLRATLSPGELFLLMHHGIAMDERSSFRKLAGLYGLFDDFELERYDLKGAQRLWYGARQVKNSSLP